MHDTIVVMKDGTAYVGLLLKFRPREGWLSLMACNEAPDKIYLRDVQTAITKDERYARGVVRDVDELERARGDGWDGT